MIPKGIIMIANGEITFEDGEVIDGAWKTLMITLFSIVWLAYLPTIFSVLKIVFIYKCKPFEITPEGIKNTFVCINLLCFMIIRPVKLIPWDSVKWVMDDEEGLAIRVRVKKVKAGLIAKLMLLVLGYVFCMGMAKPKLSEADKNLCMLHCKGYAQCL